MQNNHYPKLRSLTGPIIQARGDNEARQKLLSPAGSQLLERLLGPVRELEKNAARAHVDAKDITVKKNIDGIGAELC